MRILITGITGMIGTHLSAYLRQKGYEVEGISRPTSDARMNSKSRYLLDILDKTALCRAIQDFKPEVIYHLAAQSFNGDSWKFEDTTYAINIQGSRNVFDAWRDYAPNAVMIPACSSAEYGGGVELKETDELKPLSPYGCTKAMMEMMCKQYSQNYKLCCVIPRLFIHVGVNHPPATAVQNFARQVALMAKGKQELNLLCGKLDTFRDYVDIRDGVLALELLMNLGGNREVYNICSGRLHETFEIVDILRKISGLNFGLKQNNLYVRPSDEQVLLGEPHKINELGWEVKIPFEQTIQTVYENWLTRV